MTRFIFGGLSQGEVRSSRPLSLHILDLLIYQRNPQEPQINVKEIFNINSIRTLFFRGSAAHRFALLG